jgi:hypothetical protein
LLNKLIKRLAGCVNIDRFLQAAARHEQASNHWQVRMGGHEEDDRQQRRSAHAQPARNIALAEGRQFVVENDEITIESLKCMLRRA